MDLALYPFLTLEMAFKKNFIVVKMEDKAVNFHWLLIKAKPRLLYAILVGIVTYFLLHDHYLSTRFLIAWSAASATYLILVFVMMQYFNRKKNISSERTTRRWSIADLYYFFVSKRSKFGCYFYSCGKRW